MSFLGSISKALGGAALGFLGSGGNPVGAILGGVGGLLSGRGNRVETYTPPTTQEAQNIIESVKGQVGDIASRQYNIEAPYLNEALSVFQNFPNTLNQLFSETEETIDERYGKLFNNIQSQMQNEWSKSALGLSALGMYNTPATQLRQSDIVNQLYGKIAEQETQALNKLDIDKMTSFIDYYNKAPMLLSSFGETFASIDPAIKEYEMKLQLAGLLNGLNTIVYPKISPLAQAGQMINTALLNNAKNLPSWDSVVNSISGIFGGGSRFSFSPPSYSYGWGNALNNAFPVPNIFG
jgi:hypothetical protein